MISCFREWLGFWLIEKTLRILPVDHSTREGMMRGLREQREYDRYEAWCEVMGNRPMEFYRWREVRQWLRVKGGGAEATNAAIRPTRRRRTA